MTDEQLESIIDRVNDGNRECAFLRPLIGNVDYGLVWLTDPNGTHRTSHGYGCFMIRREDGRYIGAVLEMFDGQDLHAFVKPEHRRKGVMTAALCKVVFPHLKSRGMGELTVTLHSIEGTRLAEKLGFIIDETFRRGTIDLTAIADVSFPVQQPVPIDDSRVDPIMGQFRMASQQLMKAADEIEIAHTDESNLVRRIRRFAEEVHDLQSSLVYEREDLDSARRRRPA